MGTRALRDTPKIIRRVRHRTRLGQDAFARLLNVTKGALAHWERGRKYPALRHLIAMRQICPASAERKQLDTLIREKVASGGSARGEDPSELLRLAAKKDKSLRVLRRQNIRLQRRAAKLRHTLQRQDSRVRTLNDLVTELQGERANLHTESQSVHTTTRAAN